jgi:hypothetical protein
LVRRFPLRPIRNEKELDRAIAIIDALLDRERLTVAEEDYGMVGVGSVLIFGRWRSQRLLAGAPRSMVVRKEESHLPGGAGG